MADTEIYERKMWDHGHGTGRIDGLTDGLMAIAMTILVLELSLDHHILEAIGGGHFGDMATDISAYIMGFLILGIYWVLHHWMFHFIVKSDGVLVWMNVVFLMLASLVPLSTKVQRLYPDSEHAYFFFFLTTMLTIVVILLMWVYATRGHRLVEPDLEPSTIRYGTMVTVFGPVLMVFVLIGYMVEPWLGWVGFVPLIYMIVATGYGHHKPFME